MSKEFILRATGFIGFFVGFQVALVSLILLALSSFQTDVVGPIILGLQGDKQIVFQLVAVVNLLGIPAWVAVYRGLRLREMADSKLIMANFLKKVSGLSVDKIFKLFISLFSTILLAGYAGNFVAATYGSIWLATCLALVVFVAFAALIFTTLFRGGGTYLMYVHFVASASVALSLKYLGDGTSLSKVFLAIGGVLVTVAVVLELPRLGKLRRASILDAVFYIPALSFLAFSKPSGPAYLHPFESFWYANVSLFKSGNLPWINFDMEHGVWEDFLRYQLGAMVGNPQVWGTVQGYSALVAPLEMSIIFIAVHLIIPRLTFSSSIYFLWIFVSSSLQVGVNGLPRMIPMVLVSIAFYKFLESTNKKTALTLGSSISLALLVSNEALYGILAVTVVLILLKLNGRGVARIHSKELFLVALTAGLSFILVLSATGLFGAWIQKFLADSSGYFLAWGANFQFDLGPTYVLYLVAIPITVFAFCFAITYTFMYKPEKTSVRSMLFIPLMATCYAYYVKFLQWPDWHLGQSVVLLYWIILFAIAFTVLRHSTTSAYSRKFLIFPVAVIAIALLPQVLSISNDYKLNRNGAAVTDRYGLVDISTKEYLDSVAKVDEKFRPLIERDSRLLVFDFGNEPVTWFGALQYQSVASSNKVLNLYSSSSQSKIIKSLEEQKPLSIIWGSRFGYWAWPFNGTWMRQYIISEYILDNYTPALTLDGYTLMTRKGIDSPDIESVKVLSALNCDWGSGIAKFKSPKPADLGPSTWQRIILDKGPSSKTAFALKDSPASQGFYVRSSKGATVTMDAEGFGTISFDVPKDGRVQQVWLAGCPAWKFAGSKTEWAIAGSGEFEISRSK